MTSTAQNGLAQPSLVPPRGRLRRLFRVLSHPETSQRGQAREKAASLGFFFAGTASCSQTGQWARAAGGLGGFARSAVFGGGLRGACSGGRRTIYSGAPHNQSVWPFFYIYVSVQAKPLLTTTTTTTITITIYHHYFLNVWKDRKTGKRKKR